MQQRIAYVPGVYDMFHVGHLNILRQASLVCDRLIAGVVSDDMCQLAKGKRPVVPLRERLEIVSHISYVDEAVEEDVPEKTEMWRRLQFNVIVKGDDWRGTAKGEKLESDFEALGVEVVYLPYTVHTSSTKLREALDQGLLAHG
jgi:glycerol-3-phosphate cytidylyltransferase